MNTAKYVSVQFPAKVRSSVDHQQRLTQVVASFDVSSDLGLD
jgi:hypothetical protein